MTVAGRTPLNGRARRGQTYSDVVAAEFLKARTLPAQGLLWTAGALGSLLGTVTALVFASILRSLDSGLPVGEVDALIARSPIAGAPTMALFLGFAAIHLFANERSSGRDRRTALEVPLTVRVLDARIAVASVASLAVALLCFGVGAAVTAAAEASGGTAGPIDLGLVVASALTISAVALATSLVVIVGACIGSLVTHGVVAAAVLVVLVVLAPAALRSLGLTVGNEALGTIAAILPADRLGAVMESAVAGDGVAVIAALGVLVGWAALLTVVARVRWNRGARVGNGTQP